jgi:putative ABC transport system ATP-binding protein
MTAPRLEVEHLTKRYGSGATEVVAVRDLSLTVAPGEVVLVMGPSGSGKTTLLLMLGGLLRPTEGPIRLDGSDIATLGERKLPAIRLHQVGFVFQDFNLLSALTVLENVAVVATLAGGRAAEARRRAEAVLRKLGLRDRLGYLPEKLSGGEKQRVAIARALVNDPALILADEPTANLDARAGHEVVRLLRDIAREQGRSVVIVSHDQRIRDVADRVLWLEDGRLRELAALATDPVCQMQVDPARAVVRDWRGRSLSFCSRGCEAEFMADPDSFVTEGDQP